MGCGGAGSECEGVVCGDGQQCECGVCGDVGAGVIAQYSGTGSGQCGVLTVGLEGEGRAARSCGGAGSVRECGECGDGQQCDVGAGAFAQHSDMCVRFMVDRGCSREWQGGGRDPLASELWFSVAGQEGQVGVLLGGGQGVYDGLGFEGEWEAGGSRFMCEGGPLRVDPMVMEGSGLCGAGGVRSAVRKPRGRPKRGGPLSSNCEQPRLGLDSSEMGTTWAVAGLISVSSQDKGAAIQELRKSKRLSKVVGRGSG